jgi:ankyrin repeat protein
VGAVDRTGKTALTVAMERGFEKAVEFLINSGACVDLRTDHGRSVLLLIAERSWATAGTILSNQALLKLRDDDVIMENQIRLLLATYDGDLKGVIGLLSQGILDPQGRDRETGDMALFLAVEREQPDIAECLVDAGVSVNSRDTAGCTALFRATRRRHEATIKLLLARGIDADAQNDEGLTAWSANVRLLDKRILGLLLEAGADPSTRGLQGVSELYTAAKEGDAELVKFMLDSGTNPCVQTEYFWAPIHWAAAYGHVDCVKLLIDAGADVGVKSDQGVTPLDLAAQAEQIAVCEILMRARAETTEDVATPRASDPAKFSSVSDRDWLVIDQNLGALTLLKDDESLSGKLFLVFDKPLCRSLVDKRNFGQFAYPREQRGLPAPDGYIYQVSQVMETTEDTTSVRLANRRAEMCEYPLVPQDFNSDDVLYDVRRLRSDSQEYELQGRHQNPLHGGLRFFKEWTGSWKVQPKDGGDGKDFLLRATPDWSPMSDEECRWVTEDGGLCARSGWDDETPNLCLEAGLQRQMVDVIVVCWICKLWAENAVKA